MLEALKQQLFDLRLEQQAILHEDDESKNNALKEKIKEVKKKIALLKLDKIKDDERLEELKKQLEDAHFDEIQYKNNPEKYAETRERIKGLRKEIAKLKSETIKKRGK